VSNLIRSFGLRAYCRISVAAITEILSGNWEITIGVCFVDHWGLGGAHLQISAWTLSTLTERSWFFSVLPGRCGGSTRLGHDLSRPDPFQFSVHQSSFHSVTRYVIWYWPRHNANRKCIRMFLACVLFHLALHRTD